MGFKLKKAFKKLSAGLDKITGTDQILGDMSFAGHAKQKQEQQAVQAMEIQRQLMAQQQAANLQRNLQEDLSLDNVANVEAGGSAFAAGDTDILGKKRRAGGAATISSKLGIAA
jgi:hypothetical protein